MRLETRAEPRRWKRFAVEVLTDHNNLKAIDKKVKRLQDNRPHDDKESGVNYLWVFENRKHAFKILNRMQSRRQRYLDLQLVNGQFDNPENWPIAKANEYIWRTRRTSHDDFDAGPFDVVATIPQFLRATGQDLTELIHGYHLSFSDPTDVTHSL
jgi:hypothetical protein